MESSVSFNFDQLPVCYIPGSYRASISIAGMSMHTSISNERFNSCVHCVGDIASPPNLDNLLILPSGCGEQNLVKLALNSVVANYLQQSVGLSEHTAIRVRFNLQTGKA